MLIYIWINWINNLFKSCDVVQVEQARLHFGWDNMFKAIMVSAPCEYN